MFVFLAARRFAGPHPALLTALAFGLGSCVWPISSQALWQHPATTFFLSLGAYFLLGIPERRGYAAGCGAALGMAVLSCRPTSAIVVVCVGAYLLWANRRWFAAMCSPDYRSPSSSPPTTATTSAAPSSSGRPSRRRRSRCQVYRVGGTLWQSPILESLPGLFISPSRGLAFYSPVLLFGLVGAVLAWKDRRYRPLIPLQVATLLLILVAAKWFDWWGGSTYGYRPIVDTAPFLALMMIPVIDRRVVPQPLDAGPLRCAASMVGRRAIRRGLVLQRDGMDRSMEGLRQPRQGQPVAVDAPANRLPYRQLPVGESDKEEIAAKVYQGAIADSLPFPPK